MGRNCKLKELEGFCKNLYKECATNQPECKSNMELTNNAIGGYVRKGKGIVKKIAC
jgi:hypothetical protein